MSNRLRKGDGVPFTQIHNEVLFHPELSLKAKGLYSYMYAKPDDWNFTASSMAAQLKEGKRAILNILNELKEFGLLEYKKLSNGKSEYTIYSSINPNKQPKCKNSTLPKNSQSAETAPCKKRTVQKQHRINNKDTITNKEDINNTPISPKGDKGEKGFFKKSSLGLDQEVATYKKKVIEANKKKPLGLIGRYWVEDKQENVFIDAKGYLYTDTRNSKQIVTSTLKELWTQIYEFQKIVQNQDKERLMQVVSKLKGN